MGSSYVLKGRKEDVYERKINPMENLSLYESKKIIDIGLYLYDVQKNLDLSDRLLLSFRLLSCRITA